MTRGPILNIGYRGEGLETMLSAGDPIPGSIWTAKLRASLRAHPDRAEKIQEKYGLQYGRTRPLAIYEVGFTPRY